MGGRWFEAQVTTGGFGLLRGTRPRKGRGTASNPDNRFESHAREAVNDGWPEDLEPPPPIRTTVGVDSARSVITYNRSPDVPFDRSINTYRGCEHGCVYCFARPTHAYYGHSAGLDFETRLYHKPDAAKLLREELRRPGYRCQPIALGVNTDGWQPAERRLRTTRAVLEVLREYHHPVNIITKGALIERDIDVLAPMAEANLVTVLISITTLDTTLARKLEPRTTAPSRRLETIARLRDAGIPAGVLTAPVIPGLTDHELESILESAREHGAQSARYILLRLPHEVKTLFKEWLEDHYPEKASRVLNLIRDTRGGKIYDSSFGTRMHGTGAVADLIAQRFELAARRLGLEGSLPILDCNRFEPPKRPGEQLSLF